MVNIVVAPLILVAAFAVSYVLRPVLRRGWSGIEDVTDQEWVMGRQHLVLFAGFLVALLWLWLVSPPAHNQETILLFIAFAACGFSLRGIVSGTRHRGSWWLLLVGVWFLHWCAVPSRLESVIVVTHRGCVMARGCWCGTLWLSC